MTTSVQGYKMKDYGLVTMELDVVESCKRKEKVKSGKYVRDGVKLSWEF